MGFEKRRSSQGRGHTEENRRPVSLTEVHGWWEKERMNKVRKIREVSGDETGP